MDKGHSEERIDFRSDKTRRILFEEPPLFVRIGTLVVTVAVGVCIIIVCLSKYKSEYLWTILFGH